MKSMYLLARQKQRNARNILPRYSSPSLFKLSRYSSIVVVQSAQNRRGDHQFIPTIQRNTADFCFRDLLLDTLVWSRLIEILRIGMKHTMQLLFIENEEVIEALSPNTPQKAFADRIGSWRLIGCFQYLDAARCCNASETGSKLAIVITDEILRSLAIRSRLPQLLCGPSVGRSARHTYVDDFPRFQFDEEKRKERPKEKISDLEKIASPDFTGMIAQEGRPLLPSWATVANVPHVFLDRAFAHTNTQFEQLTSDALRSPEPIVPCHLLDQCDRLWRELRLPRISL